MDLIEDIGPILGIVAFLGFAILALLIVLQAREVRRLREWAGRAPERAAEADEAALAAAEAAGITTKEEGPGRIARTRERLAQAFGPRWDELDRRSPIDPKLVVGVIALVAVAAGVVTSGFGLVGGSDEPATGGNGGKRDKPDKIEVAVLNATQQEGVADPIPGVADFVAKEVVQPAGFSIGVKTDALTGEEDSVIMFEPEAEADAETLASEVEEQLGQTELVEMTDTVRDQVRGAPLAVLVGLRDAALAETAGDEAEVPDTVVP